MASKGYARGRAAVSTRHTLALVNRGGATAEELLALAREIQETVSARFGVMLRPEPVFVGF
jgi:UDP-N-acetylmuramate dehydrogenase